jgi:hypothetical protein
MSDVSLLLNRINLLYRSWHVYEEKLPADRASVLDFDYCPWNPSHEVRAFNDRVEILESFETIFQEVKNSPPTRFSNHEMFLSKLRGAISYLRALLGEKIAFDNYVQAVAGVTPKKISNEEMECLRENAREIVASIGCGWRTEERDRYDTKTLYPVMSQFGEALRSLALLWVKKVQTALSLDVEPSYDIEATEVDEYWHNWISGSLGQKILLRVNTHPRGKFRRGEDVVLAAHEIAGHAMHVLSLNKERERGVLESSLMNLTVHSCEMFQMEGLAQSILELLTPDEDILFDIKLYEAVGAYHDAVRNNAQCEMEEGRPIDEVIAWSLASAPLSTPKSLISDLRDRSRNPLFRAYIHVYGPAKKEFMRAAKLSEQNKHAFLKEMYTRLWTPRQISNKLDQYLKC